MMRLAWVFVRLRWRLFINHVKAAADRDPIERASRAGALITPALIVAGLGSVVAVSGVLGLIGGWLAGGRQVLGPGGVLLLRVVPALTCLLVVLMSVTAVGSRLTLHSRLLLLPIPPGVLHRIDLIAGALSNVPIVGLASASILFAAGLLLSGRPGASLVAVVAAAAMLVLLAALNSVLSLSIGRLLQRRRAAEFVTLAFVVGLSLASGIPVMLTQSFGEGVGPILEVTEALPWWTGLLPSELHAGTIAAALAGHFAVAFGGLTVLVAEGIALVALSSRLHRRLLDSRDGAGGAPRRTRAVGLLPRLPLLSPGSSAVAVVQTRSALRSVRGRLIVLLPGVMVGLLSVVSRRIPDEIPGGRLFASSPDAILAFGLAFSLYALLAFTMNQFAADRAGLTLQFLEPVTDAELIYGKAVGCGLVFVAQATMCVLCLGVVMWRVPGVSSLAIVLGSLISYFLIAPAAAVVSAVLPVRSDVSKTGTGGNPHGLAMLGGTVAIGMLTTIQWKILSLTSSDDSWQAVAVAALCAVAALVASALLLSRAAMTLAVRRENIGLVAQGR